MTHLHRQHSCRTGRARGQRLMALVPEAGCAAAPWTSILDCSASRPANRPALPSLAMVLPGEPVHCTLCHPGLTMVLCDCMQLKRPTPRRLTCPPGRPTLLRWDHAVSFPLFEALPGAWLEDWQLGVTSLLLDEAHTLSRPIASRFGVRARTPRGSAIDTPTACRFTTPAFSQRVVHTTR